MMRLIARLGRWLSKQWYNSLPRFSPALTDLLREKGFTSYADFAETQPSASLSQLTLALGAKPAQERILLMRMTHEALVRGDIERHARSLFVRFLNNDPPAEFRRDEFDEWGVVMALYRVAIVLPQRYRAACHRIALAYEQANIPANWKPKASWDSYLVELFSSYWPQDSVQLAPGPRRTSLPPPRPSTVSP